MLEEPGEELRVVQYVAVRESAWEWMQSCQHCVSRCRTRAERTLVAPVAFHPSVH